MHSVEDTVTAFIVENVESGYVYRKMRIMFPVYTAENKDAFAINLGLVDSSGNDAGVGDTVPSSLVGIGTGVSCVLKNVGYKGCLVGGVN